MNAYYTHQKYLTEELNKLDYSNPVIVLEFGTGDGSASIFYRFVNEHINLRVQSYDDSFSWYSDIKRRYYHQNYNFNYTKTWEALFEKGDLLFFDYDLVFVDAGPDFDARIKIINYMKANSKVIVLHDYDFYNKGIMEDHYFTGKGSFFGDRYSKEFILQGNSEYPGTLVMRNKKWITT
jgi:hypothetical protein